MSLAKVILSGTVASEPEKRFTPNQNVAVTNFNLAVTNPSRSQSGAPEEPFLVKVVCWRAMADAAAEQLQKGDSVVVEGKLLTSSYQTPEGVAKKGFEVEAANIDKIPGTPEPLLVGAATGAATGGGSAPRSGGGGYATPPSGNSGYSAGNAQPASAGASQNFSSEELLTEDDIPF